MIAETWKTIETLFERALELPAVERSQFLQTIADEQVRDEVASLLAAREKAETFLENSDEFFSTDDFGRSLGPGELIGRYRIIREIGRGGMGAVFLAERADDEYRKQVGIKVIKRGTDTDAVLRYFRNERQNLGRIRSSQYCAPARRRSHRRRPSLLRDGLRGRAADR